LYVEGKVSIPDATTGLVAREIPIGQCLPYDVAQKTAEVLAPQTTVAGAFATSAVDATAPTGTTTTTATTTATVNAVKTLPSICVADVVSVVQKTVDAVKDPVVTNIFKDGIDSATVVAKWADQIKTDATLSGVIPRIISFGVPKVSTKGDVTISTIVEVVSTAKLSSTQLTTLCAKYKQSVASTVGTTDALFSACVTTEIKTLSSNGKKREVLQTTADQYLLDVSYSRGSGSSAMTISSLLILMLVVLLFGLNA
jgi:hypothetical protein